MCQLLDTRGVGTWIGPGATVASLSISNDAHCLEFSVSGAVGRNHHLAHPFGTDQNIHLPRVAAATDAAAAIVRTVPPFGPFSEMLFWCSTPDTLVSTT
jgi:hypothetical protein